MKIKRLLTKLAGKGIQIATAGVIDSDDIFDDEDLEIEEAQLLQLIAIRAQNKEILVLLKDIYHG